MHVLKVSKKILGGASHFILPYKMMSRGTGFPWCVNTVLQLVTEYGAFRIPGFQYLLFITSTLLSQLDNITELLKYYLSWMNNVILS